MIQCSVGGYLEYFGVAELRTVTVYDLVVRVLTEGVAVVVRVGDVLGLPFGCIEGVDCDNASGLVQEETGRVVRVYDCAAGEYAVMPKES